MFQYNTIWTSHCRNTMVCKSGLAGVKKQKILNLWGEDRELFFFFFCIVGLHILYCPITKEVLDNVARVTALSLAFFCTKWELKHPFPEPGGRPDF